MIEKGTFEEADLDNSGTMEVPEEMGNMGGWGH